MSGKGSRELSIHKAVFAIADNGVEFDPDRDLDNGGRSRNPSRKFLFLIIIWRLMAP